MNNFEDWTYNDFLTYLLILGANADLDISDDEKEEIESRVGVDEFKRVKRCFDLQNDAQHIDTVALLYNRFELQIGGKENLVKAIREILTLHDRTESVMDRYLMIMLKKILD